MIGNLILGPFVDMFVEASGFFVNKVLEVITATTTPQFDADWFSVIYNRVTIASSAIALMLVLFAAASGAIRGSGRVLGSAVGHTVLWGFAVGTGPVLVGFAVKVVDWMCAVVAAGFGHDAGKALVRAAVLTGPLGVQLIGALGLLIGGLSLFVEMVIRDAMLLLAVSFIPLGAAGMIWSVTQGWARKLGRLLAVALAMKFIIVLGACIAMSVVGNIPASFGAIGMTLAAAFVLLIVAIIPAFLLKHSPGGAPMLGRSEVASATGAKAASRVAKAGITRKVA